MMLVPRYYGNHKLSPEQMHLRKRWDKMQEVQKNEYGYQFEKFVEAQNVTQKR